MAIELISLLRCIISLFPFIEQLKFCWSLLEVWAIYISFFLFKFLLAREVLSYVRKSYSLNNAGSSSLNFIGNLLESAEFFFIWIKRLCSQSSFDIWFLQKCALSLFLAWYFAPYRQAHYFSSYTIAFYWKWNLIQQWLNPGSCMVCQSKFESLFILLLLYSEEVSSTLYSLYLYTLIFSDLLLCIIFIWAYILNIFYCIT